MSDAVARVGVDAAARMGLTDRTVTDIRNALAGRTQWRSPLLFAGPAVVASIAYMDPGNFATNIGAGARYGYALLWVVLTASIAAMLFQSLSAKLGIVTGRNLAELCREHFPKPVVWALWIVSEVAAMATDLAEFLGGAIGLSLLLHIPLIAGMGVTGVLTYGILMFEGRGFRPTELIIGSLVAAIALCYLVEMVIAPVDWAAAGLGSVVPRLPDAGAVTLAVGIVGATIMPHAIFHHAARDFPAFRAHSEPGAGAQRPRAAAPGAVLEYRGPRRPRYRRPRQYGDGHHGGERVPCRPQRRRRDWDCL
jgi:manganese transport protein